MARITLGSPGPDKATLTTQLAASQAKSAALQVKVDNALRALTTGG
jgi:hypothetical protein